jgi:hypothetical protein
MFSQKEGLFPIISNQPSKIKINKIGWGNHLHSILKEAKPNLDQIFVKLIKSSLFMAKSSRTITFLALEEENLSD